jgi:hypothetical protein
MSGLEELVAKVNSFEFEEFDGSLYIEAIKWHVSSLELTLAVGCGDDALEYWHVTCDWILAHCLRTRRHGSLMMELDHPVLWPHNSSYAALYFSSAPDNPAAVFGSLVKAHLDLVSHWFPISQFMNRGSATIDLLSSGNGLLAQGPTPVIDRFRSILDAYGIRNTTLPLKYGTRTYNIDLKPVALVFDDSYVASHAIKAENGRP